MGSLTGTGDALEIPDTLKAIFGDPQLIDKIKLLLQTAKLYVVDDTALLHHHFGALASQVSPAPPRFPKRRGILGRIGSLFKRKKKEEGPTPKKKKKKRA